MAIDKNNIRDILANSNDGFLIVDLYGNIDKFNDRALKLLNITEPSRIRRHINSLFKGYNIQGILDKGTPLITSMITDNGKKLVLAGLPINNDAVTCGAMILLSENHDAINLSQKIGDMEILNTVLDTFDEWIVVVNKEAKIIMMSKSYKQFLGIENPEGKHVTEVIENTRMHIVVDKDEMELGEIQNVKGRRMIAMRIPLLKEGNSIGAVGKTMFKDVSDLSALNTKISRLEKEIEYYKSELDEKRVAKYCFQNIIGNSQKMIEVKSIAKKASKTDSNVLIIGESGTGKELFASAIHNSSKRVAFPFIKVNCAAIPSELLESELFGYEEGAFTGAKKNGKKGKFEIANGGTILLDEIGDMPLTMQAKLLRVLQEKEIERLGGNSLKSINVRIIASTNKDLEYLVKKGEFREDLYYRLNVMVINPPPLRERKDDISELAEVLKNKIANNLGVYVESIAKESLEYMLAYDWPGNIRELENVIERAINLLDSDLIIKPKHLPRRLTENKTRSYAMSDKGLKGILEEVEKKVIKDFLVKTNGNKNKTSKLLGISRVSLYNKIEKYGLTNIN